MVLSHLGTDGPLHSGTHIPFLIFFFLFLSGTDGPVAFGHRWSLAFGHRWSLFNFFFFFFLSGTDGPVAFGHRWSLAFGTDSPIACGHRSSISRRAGRPTTFADSKPLYDYVQFGLIDAWGYE